MNVTEVLQRRYSTKEFDPNKKISDADFEQVKNLLQLSPNSTNIQPWHFIIASSDESKKRIAKSTEGVYAFNTAKILDASHVVVFCSLLDPNEEYLLHVLEKEDADGRFSDPQFKEMMHAGRSMFLNMHKYDLKDMPHWLEKQVYLNLGNLLLGVALLGIDALPMEGADFKVLDAEFGLRERGFTGLAVVALGYGKESDFNRVLPKSRLSQDEIFTRLD